jgi:hypothetical protein
MKKEFRELEIGNEIMDLIHTYQIPLLNFGLALEFATPKYDRVHITMDYSPGDLVSDEAVAQKIDFVSMARDLAKIIHNFGLPTDMFGLTIFVNSKNFDILAKKNPAIAERDIVGRLEKKGSKPIWYIQIIRLLDAANSNQIVS